VVQLGNSDTWVYHGYDNSDVVIDGKRMKSVPGVISLPAQ
jgi:hypothetical protein